jgi:uncharacterized protein YjbJ (UPF0337 family)
VEERPDNDERSRQDEAATSIVEDVKGKAKEVAGRVLGDETLEEEGRIQQDKAEAARKAAEHEARAEEARAEEDLHEARLKVEQAEAAEEEDERA